MDLPLDGGAEDPDIIGPVREPEEAHDRIEQQVVGLTHDDAGPLSCLALRCGASSRSPAMTEGLSANPNARGRTR